MSSLNIQLSQIRQQQRQALYRAEQDRRRYIRGVQQHHRQVQQAQRQALSQLRRISRSY